MSDELPAPYRSLCEATRAPITTRRFRRALVHVKAANVALRRALINGELRRMPDADARELADALSDAHDILSDSAAGAKNVAIAQAAGAAILSGGLARAAPAWMVPLLLLGGALAAAFGGAMALLSARWGHHVDRFGKTVEELRRYCGALPPPDRVRVTHGSEKAGEVLDSIEKAAAGGGRKGEGER